MGRVHGGLFLVVSFCVISLSLCQSNTLACLLSIERSLLDSFPEPFDPAPCADPNTRSNVTCANLAKTIDSHFANLTALVEQKVLPVCSTTSVTCVGNITSAYKMITPARKQVASDFAKCLADFANVITCTLDVQVDALNAFAQIHETFISAEKECAPSHKK